MSSQPLHKRVKRTLRFLLLRTALALVSALPLAFARRLGERLGRVGFVLAGAEKRKALASLRTAFPAMGEREREQLARECFEHLGRMMFELGCVAQLDPRLDEEVLWSPEERRVLDEALARGRGVVFISGHVGNWELLARRIAMAGYPSQSIAKETSDPRTTALIEGFRARGRVRSIWRGQEGAVRHMLRALKNNEILGLLIDQDTKVQSLFVPFFGEPASTPRAAADLALRTGAAVVCGFCQREPGGQYRIRLKEIALPGSGDREEQALALTARLTLEIESAIRRAPAQWVWMHRRWKTRPPGALNS